MDEHLAMMTTLSSGSQSPYGGTKSEQSPTAADIPFDGEFGLHAPTEGFYLKFAQELA